MATGRENKLRGATGEFLVAAELCRRELMATPFAGNVPHYDIIASGQHGGHLVIQVKTSTTGTWQFNIQHFIEVSFNEDFQILGRLHEEPYPRLKIVLVALKNSKRDHDHFYILSWYDLRNLLTDHHRSYLEKHGGKRPRSPRSLHVALLEDQLSRFSDRWDQLVAEVTSEGATETL